MPWNHARTNTNGINHRLSALTIVTYRLTSISKHALVTERTLRTLREGKNAIYYRPTWICLPVILSLLEDQLERNEQNGFSRTHRNDRRVFSYVVLVFLLVIVRTGCTVPVKRLMEMNLERIVMDCKRASVNGVESCHGYLLAVVFREPRRSKHQRRIMTTVIS